MGGLLNCNDFVRSIKEHRKKAEMKKTWPSTSNMESEHLKSKAMKSPSRSYEETTLARIEQVNIDDKDPVRCVGIGAELSKPIKDELIAFLKENSLTFAWSLEDMTGIDPNVTTHELNADPTYKPVKQKQRKLGPE